LLGYNSDHQKKKKEGRRKKKKIGRKRGKRKEKKRGGGGGSQNPSTLGFLFCVADTGQNVEIEVAATENDANSLTRLEELRTGKVFAQGGR